ncbi:MAG: aspartyl protease family protein [Saprospiraceae bacterium]|nr:aspartyl protease family protein [Saprospiraceae bacterium]
MKWATLLLSCLITTTWGQQPQPVLWLGLDREVALASKTGLDEEAKALEIPFQLDGGLILIDGAIKGEQGSFIFDTGSPVFLVNDPSRTGVDEVFSIGLHQLKAMHKVTVTDLSWAGLDFHSQEAYATDLQHLEDLTHKNILGIIGFEGLQEYEIQFDLKQKIMRFRPGGRAYTDHARMVKVPFEMAGHLPVITMTLGGKKIRFGLDTGASVNVIDEKTARTNKAWLSDLSQEALINDINKNTSRVKRVSTSHLQLLDALDGEMAFCVLDLAHIRETANMPIDGLLGLPFFRNYSITIDFQGQALYFFRN